MASFSIQFHATASDLAAFVEKWMAGYRITAVAAEHSPFNATLLTTEPMRAILNLPKLKTVIFTEGAADLSASSMNELLDKIVGALVLDIGRLGPRGLEESCLNTLTVTPTWRKIANDLKANTTAGVVGVHEQSGATSRYHAHRFTTAAKHLSESGISLRSFSQSPVVYRIEK